MTWLIIEAGLALAILIGIVWWTLPRRPRAADAQKKEGPGNDKADGDGR